MERLEGKGAAIGTVIVEDLQVGLRGNDINRIRIYARLPRVIGFDRA